MAGDTTLTIIGNLTDDPTSRFFDSGSFVTNFTVASTPRKLNRATGEWEDGDALFLRCNAWGQLGENIVNSLRKGHRVMVQGRLQQRSYTTKDDEKRTVLELNVDEIGPSLRYATAEVTKSTKTTQATVNPNLVTSTHNAPAEDPWSADAGRDLVGATAGGGFSDEPPF
ncbi:single-stranded DNA-binding protein [Amycolatopsis sp. NPDC051128]|uniref:single-stranded DNA-binding protein n=1 Tax=Amycolatopsis sp. NPDC051128 TaxID=3155412 RepID=UPI0034193686